VADIDIRTILSLARAGLENPAEDLKQLFAWKYDAQSTSAKGIVGGGASLALAMVAASAQHSKQSSWWPIVIGAVGAAIVIAYGAVRFGRLKLIYREYAEAQDLLREAKEMSGFLSLYQASNE
jgi:hypothetical protein